MHARAVALGLLSAALVLSACDDTTTAGGPRPRATTSVSDTPTPAPTPTPEPTPPATPGSVTIAVAGDVHFEGVLRNRLDEPATALSPASRALAAADVAVVNLETSIGDGGRPEPGKRYTFQAPPTALTALAAAGVDVATMANNHALDFGRGALPSTFAALAAARVAQPPLAVVGLGPDAEAAYEPARTLVDGTVVATIGATVAGTDPTADPTGQWAATSTSPGTADAADPRRLLRAVTAANGDADVVVVYMHWGIQGQECPNGRQRSLARALVARGADVVVGSHAHRLQGDGRLGRGYVAYGLGNYAWYTPSAEPTGVLTLTVQPAGSRQQHATVTEAAWEPASIGADGLPAPLAGTALDDFDAARAALRACAGLAGARAG